MSVLQYDPVKHQVSIIKIRPRVKFNVNRDIQKNCRRANKTYSSNFFKPNSNPAKKSILKGEKCSYYFIDQKEWITEYDGNAGRILCPRKS